MTVFMDFGDGRTWTKSSRSGDQGGTCVYVARDGQTGMIGVRDSKQGPSGQPQWHTRDEWKTFLNGAKAGEFDAI